MAVFTQPLSSQAWLCICSCARLPHLSVSHFCDSHCDYRLQSVTLNTGQQKLCRHYCLDEQQQIICNHFFVLNDFQAELKMQGRCLGICLCSLYLKSKNKCLPQPVLPVKQSNLLDNGAPLCLMAVIQRGIRLFR